MFTPSPSPPKTLSFRTPTVRNQRTLIWLQHQSPSIQWSKWNIVVTSIEDFHRWKAINQHAHAMIIPNTEEAERIDRNSWLDELYHIAKTIPFLALPRSILQWKSEDYWKDNYDNLLCLDDLHEQYPFLGNAWNGSTSDAILMFALLCRYHRLVDVPLSDQKGRPLYDLTVTMNQRPPECILYTQYFSSSSKSRTQELRECLRKNAKCKWIDRIVLLNEKNESIAWASFLPTDCSKIEQRVIGRRLRYSDFFMEVHREYQERAQDSIAILANADIYFGDETSELWNLSLTDRALCLLRWDDLGDGAKKAKLFGPRPDSQDVWIFSSESISSRVWDSERLSIPLGKPGCDNAILHTLLQQRFLLSNPALSLKTYHLHNSGVRTYRSNDTIYSSVYIHLEPTYLIDTKHEIAPPLRPQHLCNESVSFTIQSSSMSNEITYCTMLERDGRYKWEPTVENFYFEPAIPVYTWLDGVGVTGNGLVYDLYCIYTGRHAIQDPTYNYWKDANVDLFTPLTSCERMAVIPFSGVDVFTQWYRYVLYYLSRYLRLRSMEPEKNLGFWMPHPLAQGRHLKEWKQSRQWLSNAVNWKEDTPQACWANEAVGFLPSPSLGELGREDISILRDHHPSWVSTPSSLPHRKCIIVGDTILTESYCQRLREILPNTWQMEWVEMNDIHLEKKWIGASMVIVVGGPMTHEKWTPLWLLPKNAVLLEFQPELTVDGECQHVCHVADIASWIFLLSKGSITQQQTAIADDLEKWWKKHGSKLFYSTESSC